MRVKTVFMSTHGKVSALQRNSDILKMFSPQKPYEAKKVLTYGHIAFAPF